MAKKGSPKKGSPKKGKKASPKKVTKKGAKKSKGDKPKRGPSAFILYCKEERPRLMKTNPKMSVPDAGRELGKRWKALPKATQDKFKATAAKFKK